MTRHSRGPLGTVAGWIALALVGLVIACGASYAASRFTSAPVGLSSEPLTAGQELVPRRTPSPTPRPTATAGPKTRPTPTPDDVHAADHGGSGPRNSEPGDD
jgi:hypothetical protein